MPALLLRIMIQNSAIIPQVHISDTVDDDVIIISVMIRNSYFRDDTGTNSRENETAGVPLFKYSISKGNA